MADSNFRSSSTLNIKNKHECQTHVTEARVCVCGDELRVSDLLKGQQIDLWL